MKKLLALLLAAMMVLSLAACGGNTNDPSEPPAPSESTPVETKAPESTTPESTAPATNDSEWAQEATVNYFFEETGEEVPMTIKTNADHSKYNFTFMFFGEQQDMTCTADGEVLDDLTGFIGKDAQKFLTFIQEKVTDSDWKAIGDGSGAADGSEWAQEATVNYFFEETGEDVPMTIKTNADHSKYNFTFMFFGEQQDMTCTADGEVLDDLTGFIGKDAKKFLTFIQEKVTDSDWKAIG